jgi:hypothetical protein
VEDCRPFCAETFDRDLVERSRALAAAEDEQHRPILRQPEPRACLGRRNRRPSSDRPADDTVLGADAALDRVRKEDSTRERYGDRFTTQHAKQIAHELGIRFRQAAYPSGLPRTPPPRTTSGWRTERIRAHARGARPASRTARS